MLTPHFRYTLAINDTARRKLLAPGGPIDKTLAAGAAGSLELLAKAWAQRSYADIHPIEDLKRRGVMDEAALPATTTATMSSRSGPRCPPSSAAIWRCSTPQAPATPPSTTAHQQVFRATNRKPACAAYDCAFGVTPAP
ncbi:MAG: hypothetical protein GVY09_03190 [Gammaproteobacteria bacterium]|nr:hypothetical protein [Gammaproteobacteria bacterium]